MDENHTDPLSSSKNISKYARSSQSIKIGIDLSINTSIKISKTDLIDIDCIDQSVEFDDTLVSFISLSLMLTDFIDSYWKKTSVHQKIKTEFMQTVNLLTIEW